MREQDENQKTDSSRDIRIAGFLIGIPVFFLLLNMLFPEYLGFYYSLETIDRNVGNYRVTGTMELKTHVGRVSVGVLSALLGLYSLRKTSTGSRVYTVLGKLIRNFFIQLKALTDTPRVQVIAPIIVDVQKEQSFEKVSDQPETTGDDKIEVNTKENNTIEITQESKDEVLKYIEEWESALKEKDIEKFVQCYSEKAVIYNVQGESDSLTDARQKWKKWFETFSYGVSVEKEKWNTQTGSQLSVTHGYIKCSGNIAYQNIINSWVRITLVFQKIDSKWLIISEHQSIPVDLQNEKVIIQQTVPIGGTSF